jgi:hypothetical protein
MEILSEQNLQYVVDLKNDRWDGIFYEWQVQDVQLKQLIPNGPTLHYVCVHVLVYLGVRAKAFVVFMWAFVCAYACGWVYVVSVFACLLVN